MDQASELLERNARFAEGLPADLPFVPRLRTIVLTCADHRVDPAKTLGLELGDALVVRNGGGRVTPAVLHNLALLSAVVAATGTDPTGFELILMQHTECGVGKLDTPENAELLAAYFGVSTDELPGKSISDPFGGVRADLEVLASNPAVPATLSVTGLVYDINTGRAELVERRSPLRESD